MKKIVGILGMAAVLASAAFADAPAANFVLSDFTGSAEFGFKSNFVPKDAEFGMYNDTSAAIKFGLVTEGTKETTGDGVWGDLQIKYKDGVNWAKDADHDGTIPPLAFPSIEVAKIHFINGDFSAALNIANPSLEYGSYSPFVATPGSVFGSYSGELAAAALAAEKAPYTKEVMDDLKEKVGKAKEALDEAKPEDTVAYLTKLIAWQKAVKAENDAKAILAKKPAPGTPVPEIGDMKDMKAGFGLELAMADMFNFNVKFMDNGIAAAKDNGKKFGLALDAALKAVDNLDATLATSFNFGTKYTGLMATAAYKLAINDALYVKPGVAYSLNKADKKDAVHNIVGGLMFGWGAADCEPGLDYISNKTNEGVSVKFGYRTDSKVTDLAVGLYDQSLFNLLGISDFGTLKTGVEFVMTAPEKSEEATNMVAAALKYDVTLSPVYISLHGGMRLGKIAKTDVKPEFKYGVTLGSKEVIDNTDIFVNYEGAYSAAAEKATKSELKIGTKISF